MFFWVSKQTRSKAVPGGRQERAVCCDCERETRFVEVEIREKHSLFSVIDIDDEHTRAFRCVECGALGQLVDTDDLPRDQRAKLSPAAAAAAARASAERYERERAERQAEAEKREARAEIELAELKRKMGLAPAEDEVPADESPAKRSWWRRLRGG